jgi:hypothetical protein
VTLGVVVLVALATLWWSRVSRRRRAVRGLRATTRAEGRDVESSKGLSGGPRVDLIKELQRRVRASSDLPLSVRIELRAVLEELKSRDDDETEAIAAWRSLRDASPRIWNESRPMRDAVIGERTRRTLEPD